jgi:hypothetical protein
MTPTFETTVSGNTALCKVTEQDLFSKGNENVTTEQIKAVEKYRKQYLQTAINAGAGAATIIFKENKDVDVVNIEYPYSTNKDGKLTIEVNREKEVRVPGTDEVRNGPSLRAIITDPFAKAKTTVRNAVKDIAAQLAD